MIVTINNSEVVTKAALQCTTIMPLPDPANAPSCTAITL
jgi:hypothetical protein